MGKPDNQGGGYFPSTKLGCKHEMALLCQSKIKKQRNIVRMCIISLQVPVPNNEDYIIYYIISLQVHATDADSGSNGLVRYTRIIGDAVMQVLVSIRIVIISKK